MKLTARTVDDVLTNPHNHVAVLLASRDPTVSMVSNIYDSGVLLTMPNFTWFVVGNIIHRYVLLSFP